MSKTDAPTIRVLKTRYRAAAKRALDKIAGEVARHQEASGGKDTLPTTLLASALKYEQALAALAALDQLGTEPGDAEPEPDASLVEVEREDVVALTGFARSFLTDGRPASRLALLTLDRITRGWPPVSLRVLIDREELAGLVDFARSFMSGPDEIATAMAEDGPFARLARAAFPEEFREGLQPSTMAVTAEPGLDRNQ